MKRGIVMTAPAPGLFNQAPGLEAQLSQVVKDDILKAGKRLHEESALELPDTPSISPASLP